MPIAEGLTLRLPLVVGGGGTAAPFRGAPADLWFYDRVLVPDGGVRPGITHGSTDDFCYNVAEHPVHVHDLNATLLLA